MALSREDCVVLTRHIDGLIREYDPAALEHIIGSTEHYNDPCPYVVELLRTLMRFYSERSGGQHGSILNRVNRYVRLPNGQPVRGISVALTPGELQRYETEEVDLAELPDRSEFLNEIEQILGDVIHAIKDSGDKQ
jgi:hypothetical protein